MQIANDRILNQLGCTKTGFVSADVFVDSASALQHVGKIDLVGLGTRLHSARITMAALR